MFKAKWGCKGSTATQIHISACISARGNISLEVEINRASECSCTCGNPYEELHSTTCISTCGNTRENVYLRMGKYIRNVYLRMSCRFCLLCVSC